MILWMIGRLACFVFGADRPRVYSSLCHHRCRQHECTFNFVSEHHHKDTFVDLMLSPYCQSFQCAFNPSFFSRVKHSSRWVRYFPKTPPGTYLYIRCSQCLSFSLIGVYELCKGPSNRIFSHFRPNQQVIQRFVTTLPTYPGILQLTNIARAQI